MKSVVTCSNCGSSNDFTDVFCYSCGSKLNKEKLSSELTVEEDCNLFSMIRTTIYESQSRIYEYENPEFIYKTNNEHTISTKWVIALAFVTIVLFGVFMNISFIVSYSSGPNFILLAFLILFLMIIILFFINQTTVLRVKNQEDKILGDIISVFSLYSPFASFKRKKWIFKSPGGKSIFILEFINKRTGFIKNKNESYSFEIIKKNEECFHVKDSQKNIVARVFAVNDSKSTYFSKKYLISLKKSVDILYGIFFTNAIIDKSFTSKVQ